MFKALSKKHIIPVRKAHEVVKTSGLLNSPAATLAGVTKDKYSS